MASTQGIRAGRAYVELGVSDKLSAGLRAAQRRLQAFGAGLRSIGTRLMAIGASVLTPLAASVRTFSQAGDVFHKMAIRTGLSAEALSELGYAAELSGADLETLEKGLRRMQRTITDAGDGTQMAVDALAGLGLSFTEVANLAPEQQFKLIADRLSGIEDPTRRAALAMEIFGRAGTMLLPLMQDGVKGIEELQQQARDLGLTVSTDMAKDAALLNDTLHTLWRVLKQSVFVIGSSLATSVVDLTNRIIRTVVAITKWIKQNKGLVVSVAKIATGVLAAGVAFVALGYIVSGIAAALGGVATVFGVIGSAVAAVLSPIGLTIAAIGTLGTVLVIASGKGGAAIQWLSDQFKSLRGFVTQSLGAIADALAAGDISLAAKVLWASLKLAWQEGVHSLNEQWTNFKTGFLTLATDAFYGAVVLAAEAFYGLQKLWVETTSFLASKWARFSGDFRELWSIAQNEITKGWIKLMAMFDERIDVEYATRMADSELSDKLANIERETQAEIDQTEKGRKEKRKSIEDERIEALRAINEEGDAAIRARRKQHEDDIAASRDALAKAKADWQAAVAQAQTAKPEPEGPAPESLADRIRKALAGLPDALEDVRGKSMDVVGTFNAMAAFGLGASNTQERTAKATEETARNTSRIVQKMAGGLAFT